ncbi:MAG: peptide chain release factor-like protein [Phycisphaerae bacterium]|nr:peptide chain release factor-like protein [Phycisphaerae bacterium]MAB83355.1 peptide chain release factor-like protein [Phycisphaerae bacterium]
MNMKPPHPASLEPSRLLKQCDLGLGRSTGPGGQHRNRRDTAVTLTHEPTGISATATERRKQQENRITALRRLRLRLAVEVRTPRPPKPSELWNTRRQGRSMSVNPQHADYPRLLAEALDVLALMNWDVAKSAGRLGISMSQMTRLLRHEKPAFALVNNQRQERGFPPLRR